MCRLPFNFFRLFNESIEIATRLLRFHTPLLRAVPFKFAMGMFQR
jgi:hypothetical protein